MHSLFKNSKAIQDTVNKKQLLIVLPFLGAQSFLVRKQLQSCIRYDTQRDKLTPCV